MKRGWGGVALTALLLGGCAKSASEIQPAYVSPVQFEKFSCRQIEEEAGRISARAAHLSGIQDDTAESDAVATAVGVVVFWPALFLIEGDDQNSAELARMKGEFETLKQTSEKKGCDIEFRKDEKEQKVAQNG